MSDSGSEDGDSSSSAATKVHLIRGLTSSVLPKEFQDTPTADRTAMSKRQSGQRGQNTYFTRSSERCMLEYEDRFSKDL